LFDYKGTLDKTKLLISDDGVTSANVVSDIYYGDGKAKANAKFENGLIRYPGIYLNTDGQISADKRLQDGNKYHNFSYIIKSKTDYSKFKKPLQDIVHPLGTKTFVTRIDDNTETVAYTNDTISITYETLDDTFNVSYGANSIVSTNSSANLTSTVNVGDTIIMSGLSRRLQNTVNVVSGTNAIFGHANSVNFINDLQEGDVIYLSTGNTVTVTQVANSNYAYVSANINVTSTAATVNVVFNETVIANTVNANTITVKTTILGNGRFLTANVGKVR
jgi:preprotein translocase subunit YajC